MRIDDTELQRIEVKAGMLSDMLPSLGDTLHMPTVAAQLAGMVRDLAVALRERDKPCE